MGIKLGAFVLIAVVAAAAVSAPAFAIAISTTAGCHAGSHHAPSLKPVDYTCCPGGHNSAVVERTVDAAAILPAGSVCETVLNTPSDLGLPVPALNIFSSPPVSPPLLI